MSTESNKLPYIVSSDLSGPLQRWCEVTGYKMPNSGRIQGLSNEYGSVLKSCLPDAEIVDVDETAICTGLNALASQSRTPVISLDRAYVDCNTPNVVGFIDVTRAVDPNFKSVGLQPREGYPSIDVQIRNVARVVHGPITLMDDVIFSGKDMVKDDGTGLCQQLARAGTPVNKVIAGIGVGEGVDRLRNAGIEVSCVQEYPEVIDEVCKRDFVAAVPMSGRMVMDGGQVWSAPYFRPYGNPVDWASIPPEKTSEFSEFCLRQSAALWSLVEKESQSTVLTENAPRKIRSLPQGISIVSALKRDIDNKSYLE